MTDLDPRVQAIVSGLVRSKAWKDNAPAFSEVEKYLSGELPGGQKYARRFYHAMERNHWQGGDGKPIRNWRALAKAYASKCYLAEQNEQSP